MKSRLGQIASEFLVAVTWAGFAMAVVFATRPVWGYYEFGPEFSLDEQLALTCLTP
jgi:hypothetical protein